MTSRWLFVRHGESVANAGGWLAGHRDSPLTPRGRQQAAALKESLAAVELERAYASDLCRATDTARIALDGREVPLVIAPELRERALGEWEGQDKAKLRVAGLLQVAFEWKGAPPGGESQADVARRAIRWLATVPPCDGPTLVVAHGGLLRSVLGVLDRVPRHLIGGQVITNTEILTRDIAPDTWKRLAAKFA